MDVHPPCRPLPACSSLATLTYLARHVVDCSFADLCLLSSLGWAFCTCVCISLLLVFCFCFSAVFIYFGLFSKSLFGRGGADSLTRSRTQIVFPLLCNKPSLSLLTLLPRRCIYRKADRVPTKGWKVAGSKPGTHRELCGATPMVLSHSAHVSTRRPKATKCHCSTAGQSQSFAREPELR